MNLALYWTLYQHVFSEPSYDHCIKNAPSDVWEQ